MWKKLLILMLIKSIHADLDDFPMPSYGSALSSVIEDYMVNFMMPDSPVVNLFQVSHPNNTINQLYIINEVLFATNRLDVIYRVMLDVEVLENSSKMLPKRYNNVIFIDSCKSFDQIFKKINIQSWDYLGNYIIAITRYTEDIYVCMTQIFGDFWFKHIVNVVIMFMSQAQNEVLLYTFYPFSEFYCERAIPVQLNQYRGKKFLKEIDYFPEKLSNFYGCPLSVVTFPNPPFMTYKQDETGAVSVDGIEGILLRVLSQRLNFNVELYIAPENWGYVYKNGTSTGAMRLVQESKVNLTLGFFASLPPRDLIMRPSYVYFTTNLVWIVPPGRPHSALQKLMNPLKVMIWIFFIVSIIVGVIVIITLRNQPKTIKNFVFGRGIQSPGLNFFNVILGNSLHALPSRNFSRFLFIIFSYYCFIIRSSYLCGLVKFMQLDTREPIMANTKEIIDRGYTLYMLHSALAYLDEMPAVQSQAKLVSYEEFNQKLKNTFDPYFEGVFITSIAHLAYRNKMAFPNYYNYAHESIFTLNIVVYMQQDSCFKRNFDRVLMDLICSGLINRWTSAFIDTRYLEEPERNNLQALSIKQLEGAFELLIGGLVIASIGYCWEIFNENLKKIKNRFSRTKI